MLNQNSLQCIQHLLPPSAARLTSTWKLLYKSVTQFVSSAEVSAADSRQAQALQTAIQQVLLELDADVPLAQGPPAVSNGQYEQWPLSYPRIIFIQRKKQ